MKSILFFMSFLLVSCSTVEANSAWITNLLGVRNANYIADSSGTITMDGFTYTIAEVLSSFSAVYSVHVGEFSNRETSSIGYVRVILNSDALTDPRILNPLSISEIATSISEARSATLLTGSQITTVPSTVVNSRFLNNVANIAYVALQTNGSSVGNAFSFARDDFAAVSYIPGVVTTDGNDILFQDVVFRMADETKKVYSGYYLTAQWRFVKALNDTQAIYQQISLTKIEPDTTIYYTNDNSLFPKGPATDPPSGPNVYVGVEKRGDALYFHYPSEFTFYSSLDNVTFSSGYSIKVGRPGTQDELSIL